MPRAEIVAGIVVRIAGRLASVGHARGQDTRQVAFSVQFSQVRAGPLQEPALAQLAVIVAPLAHGRRDQEELTEGARLKRAGTVARVLTVSRIISHGEAHR